MRIESCLWIWQWGDYWGVCQGAILLSGENVSLAGLESIHYEREGSIDSNYGEFLQGILLSCAMERDYIWREMWSQNGFV